MHSSVPSMRILKALGESQQMPIKHCHYFTSTIFNHNYTAWAISGTKMLQCDNAKWPVFNSLKMVHMAYGFFPLDLVLLLIVTFDLVYPNFLTTPQVSPVSLLTRLMSASGFEPRDHGYTCRWWCGGKCSLLVSLPLNCPRSVQPSAASSCTVHPQPVYITPHSR